MARPKGKLFALLAVFAAIGLVAASGAFTSVAADRTATVDTAGDNSALLGLSGNSTAGVSGVVDSTSGEVELNFNNGDGNASGINTNATTTFDYVLDVTNNGNSQTTLSITLTDDSGDEPDSSTEAVNSIITVDATQNSGPDKSGIEDGSTVTLDSGETVTLSFEFDTTQASGDIQGDDILDSITINAN